jgi:DNA-binding GntR family transcriptional regulator
MSPNRKVNSQAPLALEKVTTPLSLKDQAYLAIKDAILTLKLRPGDALVENDLAEQLGISKTPVRTALQELEREGLVTKVLYKGTYVREITPRDVREIFQLRAVLEGMAARLAVPTLEESDLALARESLHLMETALEAGDRSRASQSGARLHALLLHKADNERLHLIWKNLDDQTERFRLMSDRISGRLEKSVGEHRRIVEALEQRDPELAELRMREHLHSVLAELSSEQHADVSHGGEESMQ